MHLKQLWYVYRVMDVRVRVCAWRGDLHHRD